MSPLMRVVQVADPELAGRLETIMWAQIVMAAVMLLCALLIVAAAVAVLLLVRSVMRRIDETRDALLPHVTPILSRATTIADDVREVTAGLKRDADAVHETVDDVLARTRDAVDSLDERVRRFGRVLEVVQEQAEHLLLDAAATAHGVHATARALREESPRHGASMGRRASPGIRKEGDRP